MLPLYSITLLALGVAVSNAQGDSKIIEPNLYWPRPPDTKCSFLSPNAAGQDGWDTAISKAKRFVARLTVEEKVTICTGNGFPNQPDIPGQNCQGNIDPIPRVNFSGLCYADSDTGIGNAHSFGTGFPPGVTAASTGTVPCSPFPEMPGGGTNFEGFGNDHYLIGVAGYETVQGYQGAGVQAEVNRRYDYRGLGYDNEPDICHCREGADRNLTLVHNGDKLIQTVAEHCDNSIVVVQSVGPVDMEAWVEHPNVTAIVWANLGGQELGSVLVGILYGKVNQSGRLVYTIAKKIADYAQPHVVREPQPYPQINYTEGISIDYRSFEKNEKTPRFWFGHRLSYSNFAYSGLEIKKQADLDDAIKTPFNYVADAPGGDSRLYDLAIVVSFKIHNSGPYDGVEIPQLYLRLPDEAENPTKILRGFGNVQIRDAETQTANLYLARKDISYWNTVQQNWVTPKGEFGVLVGASSNDIRLRGSFSL